ncbi:hypothetical protein VTG60DRAFT_220 [Thermothelomyces hinnuleus]
MSPPSMLPRELKSPPSSRESRLSPTQKRKHIINILYHAANSQRSLRPGGAGWIGSCSGGPAYDHRLDNRSTCGPFSTVGDFHDLLVAPLKECPRPEWVEKYRPRLPDNHEIRFAHADLSWENILLDSDTGHVTGILDWEMAGFWPAWWEYRKALFGVRCQPWWTQVLKEIMTEYPEETEVDMDLEMF